MRVVVQEPAFDIGAETVAFTSGRTDMGAVVTFTGLVRELADDPLSAFEIEHYPGMTEAALTDIATQAVERFSLGDVLVIHRYGPMQAGDAIMMVATAAPHRKDAFEAAEFLMDYLKSRAPFWKKETTAKGTDWVASKDEDEDALKRW